jgi:hypothetical protein
MLRSSCRACWCCYADAAPLAQLVLRFQANTALTSLACMLHMHTLDPVRTGKHPNFYCVVCQRMACCSADIEEQPHVALCLKKNLLRQLSAVHTELSALQR